MKRHDSIMPGNRTDRCYLCHMESTVLHLHHIFFGVKNRSRSDRFGCWVYLCPECHEGRYGVHGMDGHEVDMELKTKCQREWEARFGTREDFIREFGKNYIMEDE